MANRRISLGAFLGLTVQLGLVLGLALIYRLELERGFEIVAALILGGFIVHSWLPDRARLPWFLFLSFAAVGLLLRVDGLWVAGLGLGLLGLCHLPLRWRTRAVLVAMAAAGLAVVRTGLIGVPWASTVIPVLAAMFMFRLILYMQDLKVDRTPATAWQRLSYFFLLPNVCFPLFPVIDFKTFLRVYYDAPAAQIYQKGTFWMLRGITHLLLYRLLYHLLPLVDMEADISILGLFAFMAMTYGLYLRISGLFHLIAGTLCLFGFNLPLTNDHYFLASSFTDLWRRINIYWKDFMTTMVFYPVYFGIRRWSDVRRIVLGSACVFAATWFLHSYQWFWLQGDFPVTARDIAFWGVLGCLLVVNSAREVRHGRQRRIRAQPWSWREALGRAARTMGVFSVMSVLWSLWSSDSFLEWGYRMLRITESDPVEWAAFGGLMAGALALGVAAQWLEARGWGLSRLEREAWRYAPAFVPCLAVALAAIGAPQIHERLGRPATLAVSKARSTELNSIDANRQERGYYETLSRSTQLGGGLVGQAYDEDFANFRYSPAVRPTGDVRAYELVPNVRIGFRGSEFQANRWGQHDRDYDKAKPTGTYRFALLGSSYVMGWGVAIDQTFENLVEDRLNRELAGGEYDGFEILNFAVGGYNVLQSLHVAEHQVGEFEPDAVLYVIHQNEIGRLTSRLQLMMRLGVEFDEEYLPVKRAIDEAEAHAYLPADEFNRRLRPYRDEILEWAYHRMVGAARRYDAIPVFVLLRMTDRDFEPYEIDRLTKIASEAGALVLHPAGLFEGYPPEDVRLSSGDTHPSALGHELIAAGLYETLLDSGVELGIAPSSAPPKDAPRSRSQQD